MASACTNMPIVQCPDHCIQVYFFQGFRCPGCGVRLQVSPAYTRALLLISYMIGILLVWPAGVRGVVGFCFLWVPTAFVVLSVAIRLAPHLPRPTLILWQQSHLTTLGLGKDDDNHRHEL